MSKLFPQYIDLDKASIKELHSLFSDSTKDLQGYLFTLNGNNISKSNVAQVRTLINQRLQQLGDSVGSWVNTIIPTQYVMGQQDAARQQSHFGQTLAAGLILGAIAYSKYAKFADKHVLTTAKIISPPQKVYDLHNQSIDTTMESISQSFGTSLTAMSRSADKTVNEVLQLDIRRKIAESATAGVDTAHIQKQISSLIKDNGITALTDSAGRKWDPDVYANMLVRTKLVEARNNGLMNSLTSVGQDLVEVSSHGATDECGDWEGEILSISGNSDIYPSVADAYAGGLFHPNCTHSLNSVNPDDYPAGYLDSGVSPNDLPTSDANI